MRIIPEIDGVTIVLVGHFNPMIFHPLWFAEQEIFSPDEAKDAAIEIIHPEISVFKIEWLSVRVEKNRFIAESRMPPLIRVSDFIVSTFGDNLIHTPIGHIGINRTVHFKSTLDKIDKVGKTLAPHSAWGEWGKEIEGPNRARNRPNDKHGGLRVIVMEQRNLEGRYRGHIQAKVEPSTKLLDGICVDINDHYEVEDSNNVIGCKEAVSIVKNNFETSLQKSVNIIDQIMSLTQ